MKKPIVIAIRVLISVMRIAGILALVAAIANLLGFDKGDWRDNMTIGLLWLILANSLLSES